MLQLTLKIATRTFLKNRIVSFMSLFGLTFGVLSFHLVYVWIHNELTMDSFHKKIDRMYVTTVQVNAESELIPFSLNNLFNLDYSQFPNVENSLSIHVYRKDEIKLNAGMTDHGGIGFIVDSTFFRFFDFKLKNGSDEFLLSNPANIVLTEDFAIKIFGDTDPMGQMVDVRCDRRGTYQVAGIVESVPSNSSMKFDFLIPRHSQDHWRRIPQELILTNEFFDLEDFNSQIADMGQSDTRFSNSRLSATSFNTVYMDHPFILFMLSEYGDRVGLRNMIFIALIIALITVLGFSSLQSTLQLSGAKKMGVKKVVGATKGDLITEMMVARLGYLLISTVLAFLFFELIFPYYSAILEIEIDRKPWLDIASIIMINSTIVGISVIFGIGQIYRIETKTAFANKLTLLKVPRMQRILTTIQYAVTIVLLVATTVIFVQFNYMLNKDTGMVQHNILSVDFFEIFNGRPSDQDRQNALKQHTYITDRMTQNPDILHFSQGAMPVTTVIGTAPWKLKGQSGDFMNFKSMNADPQYDNVLGLELVQGRFFSDSLDQIGQHKVVINKAAMEQLDIEDISRVSMVRDWVRVEEDPFEIIGVVKDYHYEHLSNRIEPLVLSYRPYADRNFMVRVQEGKEAAIVPFLEELYRYVNPNGIFNYELLQDKIEAQYAKEKRVGKVYFGFTMVALLLSSIGFFNFALYETNRRTKEMGVRKVNGASTSNVFSLLGISFLKSVLAAYLIASPVAWYLMSQWLENFAYRANMSWWIFATAGLVAIIMALFAISWQTWEVARKNPVDSLRYE